MQSNPLYITAVNVNLCVEISGQTRKGVNEARLLIISLWLGSHSAICLKTRDTANVTYSHGSPGNFARDSNQSQRRDERIGQPS